jgi:hypothetical protein
MLGVAMQGLCGGAALWIAAFFDGEVWRFHPLAGYAAGMDGSRLPVCVRVVHRIYGVSLHIEEQHGGASGNIRVRESDCRADRGWLLGGEGLSPRTLLAAAVILTAVVMVITAPHRDPREAADALPAPGEA